MPNTVESLVYIKCYSSSNRRTTEDNTSGPLNRGDIADLPLLRTLLAIRQKSGEPSFWEVIDSFVLLPYASLAASRTLLQRLLAYLNFTLDSEDFSFWYKRMAAAHDTLILDLILSMRDIYINSNLNHPQNSLAASKALSLKISSHETSLKQGIRWSVYLPKKI